MAIDQGRAKPFAALEPEGITIKQLQALVLKNWKWFVLFSVLGVGLAYAYTKVILPYYRISTTLLVKDDSKMSELTNIFQGSRMINNRKTILDQIGVLKSYSLNYRTVQDFSWRYSWYSKGFFEFHKDLYRDEPYEVLLPPEAENYDGVWIYITPVSDTHYKIQCDSKRKVGDKVVNMNFEQTVAFNDVFKNDFFQFGLKRKPDRAVAKGKVNVLKFNNFNRLALYYKDNLTVKSVDENSNLVVVEMKTHQLQRDVDYLNKLGSFYIQYGLDEKNRMANNTVHFIDKLIEGVNVDLQQAGNVFTDFRSRNRTVDLGQEATAVVEQLKEIDRAQSQLNLRLDYYNNLKYYLDNKEEIKDLVAPTLVDDTDDALNSLITKLNDLYTRREVLSYSVQAKNPTLVQLDKEIAYSQRVLGEKVNSLIENTRLELRNIATRQQGVNSQLSKLPKTEQNFIGIKRNYDLNNDLYNYLLQKRAEAEIARAANNPDAQILDPSNGEIAVLIGPIKLINLISGLAGGLFIAFALVLMREYFTEKLTNIEQVVATLETPIASQLSLSRFKHEAPVLQYPKSAITESFRGLRINIQNTLKDQGCQVIAVHSSISGEGKSFVALNLALIFTVSGKRVLLVDGDLRRSRLHHVLQSKNEFGFISVLQKQTTIDDVIQKTNLPNLHFIAAGPVQNNPSELLNNGELPKFIAHLRTKFDYVIFDNAPVGVVNDGLMIGQLADANVFLLRLNHSGKDQLSLINKIYREGFFRNVLVALNGVKQLKGYGYYNEDTKVVHDLHVEAKSGVSA